MNFTTDRPGNFTQMDNVTAEYVEDARGSDDPTLTSMRYVCEVGLNLPIACLGIIGNIMAFVVLCRHKQKLSVTVLLQGLAVSDTLILLAIIVLRCLRYIVQTYIYWKLHDYLYRWGYPCVYVFRLTNTWLTVLLTIDRYIAVRYPLQAKHFCNLKRTYMLMGVVTIGSAILSIPRFFEYQVYVDEEGQAQFRETELIQDFGYNLGYRVIGFSMFMFFVPMLLLAVLNCLLLHTLRKASVDRVKLSSRSQDTKVADTTQSNRRVTIIVSAIVVIFITSNTTAMIAHVLRSLHDNLDQLHFLEMYHRYLAQISNLMVTINSAINFIIYCVCSRNFRAVCARVFHCSKIKKNCRPLPKNSSRRSQSGETADTLLLSSIGKDNARNKKRTHEPLITGIGHNRHGRY